MSKGANTPNMVKAQARKKRVRVERARELTFEANRRGITVEALKRERQLEGAEVRTRSSEYCHSGSISVRSGGRSGSMF